MLHVVRGASDVTRGQASHKTHHRIALASQPDRLRQQKLVPGFLHVEDSASRLGGLQQGVPPGAQLDELCFGADLG